MSPKPLDVFDKIERFFKDPHSPNEVPGDFSTLYLLRKDAWKCYGRDPSLRSAAFRMTGSLSS